MSEVVYEDCDIMATKENFIKHIMRECLIPTWEEAEEAFYEGLSCGEIWVCGRSGHDV